MNQRLDLSNWLIHFIHDANPDNDPLNWKDDFTIVPASYIDGNPVFFDLDEFDEDLVPYSPAFQVLLKILNDGFIRANWSFRQGKATIYGPNPAVCFTEMPLYALIEYANQRGKKDLTNSYGIAILKSEMFAAGARPVIYGLSGPHVESKKGDLYFGQGMRSLSSESGIGLLEQYRYVATNIDGSRRIDWMHEREWRWPLRVTSSLETPGLSVWLEEFRHNFSKVLVIVQTVEEAKRFIDQAKEYFDGGLNNFDFQFSRKQLLNTSVVSIEELQHPRKIKTVRLDDLPLRTLTHIQPKVVTTSTLEAVQIAIKLAEKSALNAVLTMKNSMPKDRNGKILDAFGFAYVVTYESHSEVTQALIKLNLVDSRGKGYVLKNSTMGSPTEGIISLEEAAAKAVANVLEHQLGQVFKVRSMLD